MTWLLFAQLWFVSIITADTLGAALNHGRPLGLADTLRRILDTTPASVRMKEMADFRSSRSIVFTVVLPAVMFWNAFVLTKADCDSRWVVAYTAWFAAQGALSHYTCVDNDRLLAHRRNVWRTAAINVVEVYFLYRAGLFWGLA